MNAKYFLLTALAVVGAYVTWKHFTAPKPVAVLLGGTETERVNNEPDLVAVQRDLIGGIPYGYTGSGAMTTGNVLQMAGGAETPVDNMMIH